MRYRLLQFALAGAAWLAVPGLTARLTEIETVMPAPGGGSPKLSWMTANQSGTDTIDTTDALLP